MLDDLVASGKVTHLGQSDYLGDGRVRCWLGAGAEVEVVVRKKIIDSTYMKVEVPATTPPAFEVEADTKVVPPNALLHLEERHDEYVVIGAGKTGIDAVLFLLDQGVPEEQIVWIVSNNSWLLNRDLLTPGRTVGWFVDQLHRFAESESLEELFLKTEEAGSFLRLDEFSRSPVDRPSGALLPASPAGPPRGGPVGGAVCRGRAGPRRGH